MADRKIFVAFVIFVVFVRTFSYKFDTRPFKEDFSPSSPRAQSAQSVSLCSHALRHTSPKAELIDRVTVECGSASG
jgi:hypothetical protein